MKLALIPPTPNLGDFESTGIHLLLYQNFNDRRYSEYYLNRKIAGDFLILDNGAHEGVTPELPQLLKAGAFFPVDEVVIPDMPLNSKGTWILFTSALLWLERRKSEWYAAGSPRLMFVPQAPLERGKDLWLDMARKMVHAAWSETDIGPENFTLGIPLMYDVWPGGVFDLVDRVSWLVEDTGIQIHCLGWSRNLTTPPRIARRFPSAVRSTDTAKPFVYARERLEVWAGCTGPKYPGRPSDYFEKQLTEQEISIARTNVRTFRTALGDLPGMLESTSTVPPASRDEQVGPSS